MKKLITIIVIFTFLSPMLSPMAATCKAALTDTSDLSALVCKTAVETASKNAHAYCAMRDNRTNVKMAAKCITHLECRKDGKSPLNVTQATDAPFIVERVSLAFTEASAPLLTSPGLTAKDLYPSARPRPPSA